jgi:hypothetical protein
MSPLELIYLVEHLLDNQDEVGYLSLADLRRMPRIEEEQNDEYE